MSKSLSGVKELKPAWQVNVGEFVRALEGSPKGDVVAVAPAEGEIQILDFRSGAVKHTLPGHGFGNLALAWSKSGRYLATGGEAKKLRIWDSETWQQVAEVEGGGGNVEHLCWNPARDVLASSSGKQIRLWEPSGELIQSIKPQAFTVSAIQWRPDGEYLGSIAFDGIRLWEQGIEWPMLAFEHELSLLAMAWSPSRDVLVCGTQESTILIWNMTSGEDFQAGPYPSKPKELHWDYSGRLLATGGGKDLSIWDFKQSKNPEGMRPSFHKGHLDLITDLRWQSLGPQLATGSRDGALLFWKPERAQNANAWGRCCDGEVSRIRWTPKNNGVVVGYGTGDVALWAAP